jgi:transketolase
VTADGSTLDAIARGCRVQIIRMLTHAGSGHLGQGLSIACGLALGLKPTPLKRLGVSGFGESGDARGLYAKHGLDPAGIATSIAKFLTR